MGAAHRGAVPRRSDAERRHERKLVQGFIHEKFLRKAIRKLEEWGAPPEIVEELLEHLGAGHAHHELLKAGRGPEQRRLIADGMKVLEENGINPVVGLENLVPAPNIAGQHSTKALRELVTELQAANVKGRQAVVEVLQEFERRAAELGSKG